MSVETKVITADELLAMPREERHRQELVRGELISMAPAGTRHGVISLSVAASLHAFVRAHGLGQAFGPETGFVISRNPDTVRSPDAAFVAKNRMIDTDQFFPGAPDLAIEVVSPHDTYREVRAKVAEYLRAGTRLVIVIEPELKVATVRTASGSAELTIDDTLTGGDVVPGWELPMRDLFS